MKSRKSREKVSEPPDRTKRILDVVNLLPPGLPLMDFNGIRDDLKTRDPHGLLKRLRTTSEDIFDQKRDTLPPGELEFALRERFAEHALVHGLYDLTALKSCIDLIGVTDEFIKYVQIPDYDLAWLYEKEPGSAAFKHARDSFLRRFPHDLRGLAVINVASSINAAVKRYSLAREWYVLIYDFARFLQATSKFTTEAARQMIQQMIPVTLGFEDGLIKFELSEFAHAFSGIPPERIQLCENCQRVYWAKRSDAKVHGCSTTCSKVLRTRKWRNGITVAQKRQYAWNRYRKENKDRK